MSRSLAKLTPAGGERVVAYWQHRIGSMPDAAPAHGSMRAHMSTEEILDDIRLRIEFDALRVRPRRHHPCPSPGGSSQSAQGEGLWRLEAFHNARCPGSGGSKQS